MNLKEIKNRLGVRATSARLYTSLPDQKVQCYLCPRQCKIGKDHAGFCKVRWNEDGKLNTINYGTSVQMTQEIIETEAVLHFSPGAKILSLGNIGCMMNCDYCHNWQTSQMQHVQKSDVFFYTPEEVVHTALDRGIKILSWTYNDPVVWHEFVVDTARLARKHGLLNLYKSAFYIGPQAVEELLEVIDIFSLSLKSMDPDYYLRLTKGKLEPVLRAIKQVYQGNGGRRPHLEISNLVVTDSNDNLADVEKVTRWVLENLDDQVPLHFVRFHPDYKYKQVGRTSIPFLKEAWSRAKSLGAKHVYLGNVYEKGPWLNTSCGCGSILVERFGMRSEKVGMNVEGNCKQCGATSPFVGLDQARTDFHPLDIPSHFEKQEFEWTSEINSGHVTVVNKSRNNHILLVEHDGLGHMEKITLKPSEKWRFLVAREQDSSSSLRLYSPPDLQVRFFGVLDRAHFPVQASEEFGRA